MPLAVRTDPHFLPAGVTTGSGQEDGLCAGLVVAALYCLLGGLLLATAPQLSPLGCNDMEDSVLIEVNGFKCGGSQNLVQYT